MKLKKEEEQKKSSKVESRELEVGEISVPYLKVIQHEALLTQKSLEKMLHEEQP